MKKLIKKIFKREKKEDTPELKRKKTIMFFGFYLLFFLFLFIWMKSYGSNPRNEEIKEDTEITYKTDMIENNNYQYSYYIEENDNTYTFSGVRDDENYELSEYKYKELVNIYTIKQIIKNAKYLLKVENGSDLISYKYEITNKDLAKILNYKENLEDGTNPIIIFVDKDKNIYQIDFDYSNYMKAIGEFDSYKLTVKYGVTNNEESSSN